MKPKFLTQHICKKAVETVVNMVFETMPVNKKECHVVVKIPIVKGNQKKYAFFYSQSFGRKEWKRDYQAIANSKAEHIALGLNGGGSEQVTPAHLILESGTPYWGGCKMDDIVVACSGLQPWFDQVISRQVAAMIIALARENYETYISKRGKLDFMK